MESLRYLMQNLEWRRQFHDGSQFTGNIESAQFMLNRQVELNVLREPQTEINGTVTILAKKFAALR